MESRSCSSTLTNTRLRTLTEVLLNSSGLYQRPLIYLFKCINSLVYVLCVRDACSSIQQHCVIWWQLSLSRLQRQIVCYPLNVIVTSLPTSIAVFF